MVVPCSHLNPVSSSITSLPLPLSGVPQWAHPQRMVWNGNYGTGNGHTRCGTDNCLRWLRRCAIYILSTPLHPFYARRRQRQCKINGSSTRFQNGKLINKVKALECKSLCCYACQIGTFTFGKIIALPPPISLNTLAACIRIIQACPEDIKQGWFSTAKMGPWWPTNSPVAISIDSLF